MNLTEWLQHLENLPSGLTNKSLDSVKNVAQRLDLLNFSCKVITVAGTNGKGSCVTFLESILLAAGLRIGAYLSPHVLHYNERIRLDGKDVADETLSQAFTQVENARGNNILSYFEFSTLAALVIFKRQKLDVLILEVGLGGRFDAVNIIDSDIAIITTIAFEHTKILGDTRDAIGYEKSGIMRPFKPVICGVNMPESIHIAARNIQAKLYCLSREFSYLEKNGFWDWRCGSMTIKSLPSLHLPIVSAALALMAIKLLAEDFSIPSTAIITGLENAFLLGRWQRLVFAGKEIIFDVAHNPEAASLLALNLAKAKKASKGRILAVMSILGDKDITAILELLVPLVDKWYLGTLNNVRAASAEQLSQSLQNLGVNNYVSLPTVSASLHQAIAECQEKDTIAVFGSFYTVAEGMKLITS